jgi:hypothetical protein
MKLTRQLSYMTTDPLNAATADQLALKYRLNLEVVEPRDLPLLEAHGADVILDWDFLPNDYRAKILNGMDLNVLAVHGRDLDEALSSFLPQRGIFCASRLDHHLFEALVGSEGSSAA